MKEHLIHHLEGFAHSLREGWMEEQQVYGAMLIILESAGYLKLKEEHYVKRTNF